MEPLVLYHTNKEMKAHIISCKRRQSGVDCSDMTDRFDELFYVCETKTNRKTGNERDIDKHN